MSLKQQVLSEAAKYGIAVEVTGANLPAVVLEAPHGFCFEPGTHALVSEADPLAKRLSEDAWKSALRDIREYGPRLQKCGPGCVCHDGSPDKESAANEEGAA